MIDEIKKICENYVNNRSVSAVVVATYTGGKYVLNEKSYVPSQMVHGSLTAAVLEGDKVYLIRNDGGRDYFIIDIIGYKPFLIGRNRVADHTGYNCTIS